MHNTYMHLYCVAFNNIYYIFVKTALEKSATR